MSHLEKIAEAVAQAEDNDKSKAQASVKADILNEEWANYPGKNTAGKLSVTFGLASITITKMLAEAEGDEISVYVWTGSQNRKPQYRIINPPFLVEDSLGDIKMAMGLANGKQVTKAYREDPVMAVSQAIVASRESRGL